MKTCKFFVTAERIERIEMAIKAMLHQLEEQRYQIIQTKLVASW